VQYNLDWGSGPPLHYLPAGRGGASAVVEFVRGLSPASVLPQSCRPETGSSRDRVVLPFAPACRATARTVRQGEMRMLRSRDPWQVATHLVLSEVGAAAPDDLCPRYREANATLTRSAGQLSSEEALALLGRVSQPNTRWSTLYDLRSGGVQVAMGRAYERVHEFGLPMH